MSKLKDTILANRNDSMAMNRRQKYTNLYSKSTYTVRAKMTVNDAKIHAVREQRYPGIYHPPLTACLLSSRLENMHLVKNGVKVRN